MSCMAYMRHREEIPLLSLIIKHTTAHCNDNAGQGSEHTDCHAECKRSDTRCIHILCFPLRPLNSNPSLTDLRSNNLSIARPFQHIRVPVDIADMSSSDSSRTDLQVLLKVEATAKQVANSTGESVGKLSHHRKGPTTAKEANADLTADNSSKKRANDQIVEHCWITIYHEIIQPLLSVTALMALLL